MKTRSSVVCLMAVAGVACGVWLSGCGGDASEAGVDSGMNSSGTGGRSSAGTGGASVDAGSGGSGPAGCGGGMGTGGAAAPSDGGMAATDAGAGGSDGGAYVKPAAAPSMGCMQPGANAGQRTITVNGKNINFIVNTGGYNPAMPNRLIFTLHGCGGYGSVMTLPGLTPNIHVQWQGQDSGCYEDQTRDSPEYPVFDALLQFMEDNFCIDKNRV